MSNESSAIYNFNLISSTGESIVFDWYNSAAKMGIQVSIAEDETVSLAIIDLNEELNEIKKSVSDGKKLVADTITDNGVETATDAEFATIASNIDALVEKVGVPCGTRWTLGHSYEVYANAIYSKKLFIVSDSKLYCSEDGINYTLAVAADGSPLVANNNFTPKYIETLGRWISKRNSDVADMLCWSDDGYIWYESNINNYCAYGTAEGNGIVVSYNYSSNVPAGIYYTLDGKVWNKGTGYTSGIKSFNDIVFIDGIFYAYPVYSANGEYPTYYSYDGKTWTALSYNYTGIIKVRNDRFYARQQGTSNVVWSSNGINWNNCTCDVVIGHATYGTGFNEVLYKNGMWVGSTFGGIFYSQDGKAWVKVSNVTTGNTHILFKFGKWFCVGCSGPSSGNGLYESVDGINWTNISISIPNSGYLREYFGNLYYICNKNYYMTSNGVNWIKIDYEPIATFDNILMTKNFRYSIDQGVTWIDSNLTDEMDAAGKNIINYYHSDKLWYVIIDRKFYYSKSVPWI